MRCSRDDHLTTYLRRLGPGTAAFAACLMTGIALAQTPAPVPATPEPSPGTALPGTPASPPVPTGPGSGTPVPVTPAVNGPVPTPPRAAGTPAVVVDTQDFESIMGKNVRSAADEEMGRIVDVIVGVTGEARAAVIDFGGFLGVGSRKVAVDWKALQFATGGKLGRITLALTRAQVRLSPEYKAGEPIVILGATSPGPEASAEPSKPKTDP